MKVMSMLARVCAWLVVLLLPSKAVAQEMRVPDNDDILFRTIDAESPYYLEKLLAKYFSADEQMSEEEYHYLYYGYAFSEHYKPLEPIPAEDMVLAVVEEIMTEPTEERMHRLIDGAMQVMERDPFSPKNLNFLAFAYGSIGDSINERHCFERLNGVLKTIERSGEGTKEKSPMHVLMFSHATDLLYAKGVEIKSREVVSRTAEFIYLKEKDSSGNLGYYFDFSRVYMVKPDVAPTVEKRGWRINNLPLQ